MGISPSRLREELSKWIELHLTNDISGVLLILSRAFDWGENRGSEGVITSLGGVLSSLPDNLVRIELDFFCFIGHHLISLFLT